jgi:hypothetical protein
MAGVVVIPSRRHRRLWRRTFRSARLVVLRPGRPLLVSCRVVRRAATAKEEAGNQEHRERDARQGQQPLPGRVLAALAAHQGPSPSALSGCKFASDQPKSPRLAVSMAVSQRSAFTSRASVSRFESKELRQIAGRRLPQRTSATQQTPRDQMPAGGESVGCFYDIDWACAADEFAIPIQPPLAQTGEICWRPPSIIHSKPSRFRSLLD